MTEMLVGLPAGTAGTITDMASGRTMASVAGSVFRLDEAPGWWAVPNNGGCGLMALVPPNTWCSPVRVKVRALDQGLRPKQKKQEQEQKQKQKQL